MKVLVIRVHAEGRAAVPFGGYVLQAISTRDGKGDEDDMGLSVC
jgi:hypothetical protein